MDLPVFYSLGDGMFANLKLGPKLIGGFSAVLLLFVFVMVLFRFSVSFTLSRFDELMNVEQAVSDHAGVLANTVKQAHIEENNFLSTNDFTYQEVMGELVRNVMRESETIETLANIMGEKDILDMSREIKSSIGGYFDDFNKTVEAIRARGVDEQSGLMGDFNRIVRKFTDDISFLEIDVFYLQVFRLQRYQAEYMLYREKAYAEKIQDSLDTLERVVEEDEQENAVRDIIKMMITDVIPEYQASLDSLLKKGQAIDRNDKDFKAMTGVLDELNEALSAAYFNGVKGYTLAIRNNEKNYLLTRDDRYIAATKQSIHTLLEKMRKSQVAEDYVEQAEDNLGKYEKTFDKLVEIDRQIDRLKGQMQSAVDTIAVTVTKLNDTALAAFEKKRNLTERQVKTRVLVAFVLGICAIGLGILLSITITRGITRPITDTVAFAERMAEGDLSQQIKVDRRDEVGLLANALNGMVRNLNSMFAGVSKGVDELGRESTSLAGIAGEMQAGAEKTSAKSGVVSRASEKMNGNISDVAATIEDSAETLSTISETTEGMNQTIAGISKSTENAKGISEKAVSQAKQAYGKIGELEAAAQDIGKVTDTIRDISDQTNLLALNATIESARAGEAGKGFAVVANEIKTLARQTADATREISERIEGVQGISRETMEAIMEISEVIDTINDIVVSISASMKDQERTTYGISSKIIQSSDGIQKVSDMMGENSKMTAGIVRDITDVSAASEEMTRSSHRVNQSSNDLKVLADRLKEMVNRFTL